MFWLAGDVHLYLTVPFVLSWSLLEAMAAGCCIVASDTPPVREVLTDGKTGALVDFFSPEHQADVIDSLLESEDRRRLLADAARQASSAYDSKQGVGGLDGLMSANSNQTAQRPWQGPSCWGINTVPYALGVRHTPPPWWVRL